MLDFSSSELHSLAAHHVGNKHNEGELILSKSLLNTDNEHLSDLLSRYFLSSFSQPEFYQFGYDDGDFTMNPLYSFVSEVFEHPESLLINSVQIAKHLYDKSVHPQIKTGDLFVAYFKDLMVNNEMTDAIGIYKAESKQSFLKVSEGNDGLRVAGDEGIHVDKPDKACLIFNTDRDSGYKICMTDKTGKMGEGQFWKKEFLQLEECKDEYHFTKEFMNITKNFVAEQMPEDFPVSKPDQIDMLNRSVEFFKTRDTFEQNEFEEEVFKDERIINSFRKYDEDFRKSNDIEPVASFEISPQAVKKQARVFKSVLKLDKNFHIYIHGNRELIEKGTDEQGRKFYKIFFEQEN